MNNAQYINQDSGDYEYYTPWYITEAAREVMGGIDLDPASSEIANKRVNADHYYDHDGLFKTWFGSVWMNHPFSRANNPLWINKLVNEYENGAVTRACCITYAATSARWFRPLHDYYQCFPFKRINYLMPNGEVKQGVTKGSAITYMGDNIQEFITVFSEIGKIRPPAL